MDNLLFRPHYSRRVLFHLLLLSLVMLILLYWNLDFIRDVYFRKQLNWSGYIINGSIVALFLLGMGSLVGSLLHYVKEEAALNHFVENLGIGSETPLRNVAPSSLIAHRYRVMSRMHEMKASINQSALASALVSSESVRNTLARYANNTLILTGVFGTIVSLAMALVGASDMLENSVDISGMGTVIHGMTTALNTTITAIVGYFFLGYFQLKLSDVQTNLVTGIEEISSTYLMPRFQISKDTVLYEFTDLLRSLQNLVQQLQETQQNSGRMEQFLASLVDEQMDHSNTLVEELGRINEVLKLGFRLPK